MINYLLESQAVATGSSYSAIADDDHAKIAVKRAIEKMPDEPVASVLLFLSSAYAHAPQNAIKQAAKAAGTPQIFGCCALHLLTEDEWLMDVEGAVAMAFPSEFALQPLAMLERANRPIDCVLTLTSPNAAEIAVRSTQRTQVGAVTSDEYGHGPYSVWQSGRIKEHEFSHTAFPESLKAHLLVADGIKRLTSPSLINLADGHWLTQVDQSPALESIPLSIRDAVVKQPYNLLCAESENSTVESLEAGNFKLHHVVSVDTDSGNIQLSGQPKAGRHMCWALRDAEAAEKSMQQQLLMLKNELDSEPVFALMFPNMSRGAEFFGGRDLDLDCFQGAFPNTPLIGFYGNSEITPGYENKGLIRNYSTVIAVYTRK